MTIIEYVKIIKDVKIVEYVKIIKYVLVSLLCFIITEAVLENIGLRIWLSVRLALVCVIVIWFWLKQKNHTSYINTLLKMNEANDIVNCIHIKGLGIGRYKACEVWYFDDQIKIIVPNTNISFCIPIQLIKAAEYKNIYNSEDYSIQKLQNLNINPLVFKRIFMGTMLCPIIGTILGIISALISKKRLENYVTFYYEDKYGNLNHFMLQERGLTFRIEKLTKNIMGVNCQGVNYSQDITL